jgi:radical SAM superfamily enzyme YgiQ (UPF0313 family)
VEGLLGSVEVVIARSETAARKALAGRHGLLLHSVNTPDAASWAAELSICRRTGPDAFIAVAGGPHPSGDPEGTFRLGYDVVFQGRAEKSFPRFVRSLIEGGELKKDLVVREEPDKDWWETLYISDLEGFFPVLELQRGCINRCAFCQAGRIDFKSRARPSATTFRSLRTVSEYLKMRRKRGFDRVFFLTPSAFEYKPDADSTALDGMTALLDLSRDSGMRFVEYGIFPSEVRPSKKTGPFFDVLHRLASNRRVVIGAQSFSPRMLKRCSRGHGVDDIDRTIEEAAGHGFRPYVDVMFGLPGETVQDRRLTLDAMEEHFHAWGAFMQLHHYLPLAGTPWYHLDPEPLDGITVRRIERMEKAGMTRGWWRKGPSVASTIAGVRDGTSRTI